jgi:hypothetical protein
VRCLHCYCLNCGANCRKSDFISSDSYFLIIFYGKTAAKFPRRPKKLHVRAGMVLSSASPVNTNCIESSCQSPRGEDCSGGACKRYRQTRPPSRDLRRSNVMEQPGSVMQRKERWHINAARSGTESRSTSCTPGCPSSPFCGIEIITFGAPSEIVFDLRL